MRVLILMVIVISFLNANSYSQGQPEQILGGRSFGLGGITTTLSDEFSAFNNPASLANIDKFSTGISVKNLFTIGGLNAGGLSFQIPTKFATFGISATSFGFGDFNQTSISGGIGKTLSESFNIGAKVKYNRATFGPFYDPRASIGVDLGLGYQLFPKLEVGIYFLNITGFGFNNSLSTSDFPFIGRAGIFYALSDKVNTYLEFENSVRYNANMKLGIEYLAHPIITLRGGYNTNPNAFSFGIQVIPSRIFNVHLANNVHSSLGHSPSLSFSYQKD